MSDYEPETYGNGFRCAECWELFSDTDAFDMHLHGDAFSPMRCLTIREMQDRGLIRGRGAFWYFPATRRNNFSRTGWEY